MEWNRRMRRGKENLFGNCGDPKGARKRGVKREKQNWRDREVH